MISLNDTHPRPKAALTYRIRDEAKNAAIAVLGPLAIHEFDFVTFQLDDGRWDWNIPVEERPLSAAAIKANGGKKFLAARSASMASTPMAHVEAAKPVKLPMPPRRMPRPARSGAAGAPDGGAGGEQPPSDETPPLTAPEAWTTEERIALGEAVPACNGLDVAKPDDGLDLPTFLKREPAPAKSGTYDEMKASGALRSEPVPLSPAAAQLGRMGFTDVAQNPSDGLPSKPAGKPPVSRKVAKAKTAPKAKKSATKAPTKRAASSISDAEHFAPDAPFKSKAALIKAAILDWKDDEAIVQEVQAAFPGCEYKASDIKWYRRKMEKAKA